MILELENKFAVIDLRTPKNVLDFIKNYDVDIPQLDDEDNYFRGSLYDFKEESGMSDDEIVDMLFQMEDEDEKYIEHYYYTDHGGRRVYEADIGKISYFRYDECWSEPEYPHIDKIKKEDFDKEIQEVRSFIEAYLKIEE